MLKDAKTKRVHFQQGSYQNKTKKDLVQDRDLMLLKTSLNQFDPIQANYNYLNLIWSNWNQFNQCKPI